MDGFVEGEIRIGSGGCVVVLVNILAVSVRIYDSQVKEVREGGLGVDVV